MLSTIDDLLEEASQGGGTEAMARLRSRDKMPIRERISHALDRDSPFLEISPLAAWRSPFAIGSGFGRDPFLVVLVASVPVDRSLRTQRMGAGCRQQRTIRPLSVLAQERSQLDVGAPKVVWEFCACEPSDDGRTHPRS